MVNKHPLIKAKAHKYDTILADELYNDIKIVCLVLTQPKNHKTKALHVKNTWGSNCNELIFISSENDTDLRVLIFPHTESRKILWGKVKAGFEYAYNHHFNDADWFLKADDDS